MKIYIHVSRSGAYKEYVGDEIPQCDTIVFPAESTDAPIRIPLDAFSFEEPDGGLPPLIDWMTLLRLILNSGFDSRREAIDVKPVSAEVLGKPLRPGALIPSKGWRRSSVPAFVVLTLMKMEFAVDGDESESETETLQAYQP